VQEYLGGKVAKLKSFLRSTFKCSEEQEEQQQDPQEIEDNGPHKDEQKGEAMEMQFLGLLQPQQDEQDKQVQHGEDRVGTEEQFHLERLANSFADFFSEKIDKIHHSLLAKQDAISNDLTLEPPTEISASFCDFVEVTEKHIAEYAAKSYNKSCCLDPIPSIVFKGCVKVLLPDITKIVNMSVDTATVPKSLKTATVFPLLKKPDTDHSQFANFRPVSNLSLVSKITEKSVVVQLTGLHNEAPLG
ncbi:hypothetical protein AWC38_SpisGene24652, partial [Stylophora pistillata]